MAENWTTGRSMVIAIIALTLFSSCSSPSDDEQYVADELGISTEEAADLIDEYGDPTDAIDDYRDAYRPDFDEDAAREAAESEMAGQGYDYSYGCTDDCSGHEAGWQWRADNGYPVDDPSTYGNSNSFAEGAMAYEEAVDERVDEMRDEYEYGEEPY
ncbi:hypothetical protein [Qipengyuania atrilutea]|uniref:Uncharacterized protein n=1 Tax=Qipengyuania atrilutea TaxID=2744473 RepID=A0A850H8L4_9SPHN|nr:hypothetical protein [Actirhodobacter atriluteus]NVD46133.1 hypothetical protein [Actirhodobacter atriluteus]